MKIKVLASGSKGNCVYIQTKTKTILIDTGISMLQIRNHLATEGITLDKLDAVLITHEHTDHIKYLASILDRTQATLYINHLTYEDANRRLRGALNNQKVVFITKDTKYQIDELIFVPIELSHDVRNCFGFLIRELSDQFDNITLGYVADTGYISAKYLKYLQACQILMIESNHDIQMQTNSSRPWNLINRVLSNQGHMSNDLCAELLVKMVNNSSCFKVVILVHISEECNTLELAYDSCLKAFKNELPFQLYLAKQYEALPLIEVEKCLK